MSSAFLTLNNGTKLPVKEKEMKCDLRSKVRFLTPTRDGTAAHVLPKSQFHVEEGNAADQKHNTIRLEEGTID
jgi:hypothetical protein